MLKILAVILSTFSTMSWADVCPQLRGTFLCRDNPPFNVSVTEDLMSQFPSYSMTDPNGSHTFIVDHQFHPITFGQTQAQYRAWCDGRSLFVEVQGEGRVIRDQYYIERAGLVRLRSGGRALSCKPTEGTWRYYQR